MKYIRILLALMFIVGGFGLRTDIIPAHAAEPKKVALLPFKINAAKDMSYLRDGIYDMFSTRLYKPGQVEVVGRKVTEEAVKTIAGGQTITEGIARDIGKRLNADFVVFGSISILGSSVSIDTKMVDVSGVKPTLTFFDQAADLGGIITKINLITADINSNMLGLAPAARKGAPAATVPGPAAPASPAKTGQSAKPDVHAHPEKMLKQGGYVGKDSRSGSPYIVASEEDPGQQAFWKSPAFKVGLIGLAVGDVDNDGKIETIILTSDSVLVYRMVKGRFFKIHEIARRNNRSYLGLDVGDINGNGYPEIFVSGLNKNRTIVRSDVYEYNGQKFDRIADSQPFIFRVANLPDRGRILYGQRHSSGKIYGERIHELNWINSGYEPHRVVAVPKHTSIMGLAMGHIMNSAKETAAVISETNRIRIINDAGKVLWSSSDQYGASDLIFATPREDQTDVRNTVYFPMRLLVADSNGDGQNEVLAVHNKDMLGLKLTEQRRFTETYIESFLWDGIGLRSIWKTRKMDGFIRDIAFGDFDNDGIDELIGALIIKSGDLMLTSAKSALIAYEIGPGIGQPEKEKEE